MQRVRIRFARAALLGLLAGLGVLSAGPLDLGAVRIGGVNLSWWYAGAAAPVGAVVITLAVLRSRPAGAARAPGGVAGAARVPDRRLLRALRGTLGRGPASRRRRLPGAP
jgi:hypothetical protein